MKRTGMAILAGLFSIIIFSSTLNIALEDYSSPCFVYVNGKFIGEVKDSTVMQDLKEGAYKVSMFSENFTEVSNDSLLSEAEKKAKKLDDASMKEAIALGTETILLSKDEVKRVLIKNKQVYERLNPKGKSKTLCCCLGGGTGCCLGVLALSTLMVWMNNQIQVP